MPPDQSLTRSLSAEKILRAWQPAPVKAGDASLGLGAYAHAKAIDLSQYDPAAEPFSMGEKNEDKALVKVLADEIDLLQDKLLADKRYKLLVILQGMDAAGKDGVLRGVFSSTSPLGVRTVGWQAPNERERAHDYLWRIHSAMPAAGEIVVFNRSQYEDVLVPVVNRTITPEQTRQRYAHINDFERMLTETGTVILKFMLHISKEEQRLRLQERIDDPKKHWKFSEADLVARKQWKQYQAAYGALLGATSTPWAPWTIVPSNNKNQRNLFIGTVVRDALKAMKLRYPPAKKELVGMKIV